MSKREGLSFKTELVSDVAPLWGMVRSALETGEIHSMKDCTRGGLSSALNEFAEKSGVSIWLREDGVPIKQSVRSASDMLGLDPFEITCEGVIVMCVHPDHTDRVLNALRGNKYGTAAEIIGEVRSDRPGMVLMSTTIGGTRILRKPLGEPIPRVC
jgi:hydrogenase expression/formation protein HypE